MNPAVKAITVLIAAILISFQYITALNTGIFALSLIILLFFSDAEPKRFIAIFIPALIAAFGIFLLGLYYARDGASVTESMRSLSTDPYAVRAAMLNNLSTALQLSTRLLAYAGLGIVFALTTDGEEFISSLVHQCGLSPKFAYGIIAAVNLMPKMVSELKTVKLAFRARGVQAGALSPKVLFTMLLNSIRWFESLALAMESKGFTGDRNRTYSSVTKVRWYDIAASAALIGGIVIGMIVLN